MAKKEKIEKVDGLGPTDIKKVRNAIRQVWHWSRAKRLALKRCTDENGFVYCEAKDCPHEGKAVPKVFIDHIQTVGEVDGGFLARLFCPSTGLQGLCKQCHGEKTKVDNKATKAGKTKTSKKRKPKSFI